MSEPKTYTGGCHCGAVRYEVKADLGHVMQCNCSHCEIKSLLLNFVPTDQFRLTKGRAEELTKYQFNKKRIDHLFCPSCGVESFAFGKKHDGTPVVALNVRCLDGVDVRTLTLTHFDGKSV
jgi:hypothetical protein